AWRTNTFLGFPILQCPMDLQVYQELLVAQRPEVVIQTGIAGGGSLLYLASILDLAGVADTPVIGVDINLTDKARSLRHPRITMIEADSVAPETIDQIGRLAKGRRGLVILDSDHSEKHVAAELPRYAPFVASGSYLVVEDTNVNGHPVFPSHGPGPHEATVD